MDSILTSIKKLLGIAEECEDFDVDIKMHMNTAFMILTQLGVGPEAGFSIKDKQAVWDDFIPENSNMEGIKSYVYLKTKTLFDPPLSSIVMDAVNRTISEMEWRLREEAAMIENSNGEETKS